MKKDKNTQALDEFHARCQSLTARSLADLYVSFARQRLDTLADIVRDYGIANCGEEVFDEFVNYSLSRPGLF